MTRVKGANSDYLFEAEQGEIVPQDAPDPLFLEIFICPHDQPSRVDRREPGAKICEGLDTSCPAGSEQAPAQGHARILLHQHDGLELRAGAGALRLGHDGAVTISHGAKAETTLGATDGALALAGPLVAQGRLTLRGPDEAAATFTLAAAGLSVSFGGATVRLGADGAIELAAKGGATVRLGADGAIMIAPKPGAALTLGAQSLSAEELAQLKKLASAGGEPRG